MKVGVIGSGGREHSLCLALKKSSKVNEIFCIPGNAGTHKIAENINLNVNDFEEIKNFFITNKIEIAVIGPETVDTLLRVGVNTKIDRV